MEKRKAIEVLSPYLSYVEEAMRNGWDEWKASTEYGRILFKRTRSNIVSDLMNKQAMSLLDGVKDVRVIQKHQSVKFFFNDQILLRIKKADSQRRTSNILTQAESSFRGFQLPIGGIGEVSCLEAVYVLNSLETEIQTIEILARMNGVLLWVEPLTLVAKKDEVEGADRVVPFSQTTGTLLELTEEAIKLADVRKVAEEKQIG